MNNEELQKLKALALAATPGPWMWHQSSTPIRESGGEIVGDDPLPYGDLYTAYETIGFDADGDRITESTTIAEEVRIDNLRYLGAASPDVALALIERIEALTRANLELTRRYDEQKLQEKRLELALERK